MSSRQIEGVVNRVFRSRLNEEARAWWDEAFLPRLEAKWDISNAFEGNDVKAIDVFLKEAVEILIKHGGGYDSEERVGAHGASDEKVVPIDFPNVCIDLMLAALEFTHTHSVVPDTVANELQPKRSMEGRRSSRSGGQKTLKGRH